MMLMSLYPFIALVKTERRATAQNVELVLSMSAFYVWIMYVALVIHSKDVPANIDLYVFLWIIIVVSVMHIVNLLFSVCSMLAGLTMPLFVSNIVFYAVCIYLAEWRSPEAFIGLFVTDFTQSGGLNRMTASYITAFFVAACFCEITVVMLCIVERSLCEMQRRTDKKE